MEYTYPIEKIEFSNVGAVSARKKSNIPLKILRLLMPRSCIDTT